MGRRGCVPRILTYTKRLWEGSGPRPIPVLDPCSRMLIPVLDVEAVEVKRANTIVPKERMVHRKSPSK